VGNEAYKNKPAKSPRIDKAKTAAYNYSAIDKARTA